MADSPSFAGKLVALALGILVLIGISEVFLRIAFPMWREFFSGHFMRSVHVPGFGQVTTGLPGFDGHFSQNNGDFQVRIEINKFGLRNPTEVEASDNRIWVIGDSMAFGWGVEQTEMYSTVLSELLDKETYNVASPGTNVCGYQALLARMPKEAKPQAVVIGLILENDITQYDCQAAAKVAEAGAQIVDSDTTRFGNFTDLKRELTRVSALYNFFVVSLKRVDPITVFLTKLGLIGDIETRTLPGRGASVQEAVRTTVLEIGRLRKLLPNGTPVTVLIAPARFEVRDGDPGFKDLRLKIRQALAEADIPFVDPIDQFRAAGYREVHFKHDGHWSPLGHKLAAQELSKALRTLTDQ